MIKPIYSLLLVMVLGTVIAVLQFYLDPSDQVALESPDRSDFESRDADPSTPITLEIPKQSAEASITSTLNDELGWFEVQDPPFELGSYIPDLEEQGFLKLNREKIEALQIGDVLKLWIPQEEIVLDISISNRMISGSGNIVINGNLDGNENYPFVMTVGKTSTFATISTRDAVYSLQGDTNVAWIASSAALKQHFPQKEIDYVVPNNS